MDATTPRHGKSGVGVQATSGNVLEMFGVSLFGFAMRPIDAAPLGVRLCAERPKDIHSE